MFSAQETQWLQSIIEAMHNQGYKYYLARTVTENNNEYDVLVVFSESPIIGNGLYSYKIVDGVVYSFDSSGYSSYNNNNARVAVSSFNVLIRSLSMNTYTLMPSFPALHCNLI